MALTQSTSVMHQQQAINQQSGPMAARSKKLGTAMWAQANDQSAMRFSDGTFDRLG
jgi:hypothetical protein